MDSSSEISIFDYLDYRKYLSALFNYLKETENITLRLFSRRAGFNSHSFLKQIIDGDRSASIAAAPKIAKGFDLSDKEGDYLELLIKFSLAESLAEKNKIYKKIVNSKPRDKVSKIEKENYDLFSKWHIMAIREMVTMSNFKEDYSWISKNLLPNISAKEAREAIRLLLDHNFLKRDQKGKLIQEIPILTTGSEVDSLFILNYHVNLLNLVANSIQISSELWRDVSSLSFVINRDQFEFIKTRVTDFRAELLQYIKDSEKIGAEGTVDTDSHLYYLNLQLFNASKVNWKKIPTDG